MIEPHFFDEDGFGPLIPLLPGGSTLGPARMAALRDAYFARAMTRQREFLDSLVACPRLHEVRL